MKKIFIKTIFLAILIAINYCIMMSISPLIKNGLAMNQMNSDITSNMWIQVYTYFSNYSFIIFVLVALLLYYKDIKRLIKTFKEKRNEKVN